MHMAEPDSRVEQELQDLWANLLEMVSLPRTFWTNVKQCYFC